MPSNVVRGPDLQSPTRRAHGDGRYSHFVGVNDYSFGYVVRTYQRLSFGRRQLRQGVIRDDQTIRFVGFAAIADGSEFAGVSTHRVVIL
jgi:hypothetical protein